MSIKLSELNGTNGFVIDGIDGGDGLGGAVSSAGDVNGDGIDDFIIGASGADANGNAGAGEAYVVFGNNAGFPSGVNLATLNGANGFKINGWSPGDGAGASVDSAGDFNGDGIADIIIGAPGAGPGGNSDAGSAYMVFGTTGGFSASVNVSELNGSDGFRIGGVDAGDRAGSQVRSAGDVNGDGIDDIIIGMDGALDGEAYVVFGTTGPISTSFSLSSLDGSNGFKITSPDQNTAFGAAVSSAGDINGDGIDDIIIGQPYTPDASDPQTEGAGYVVFGSTGGFTSTFDVSSLDGTNGFRLSAVIGANAGTAVADVGDVNGDGIDDLIISSPFPNGGAGVGDVIFGSTSGFASSIDLETLNGLNGFSAQGFQGGASIGDDVRSAGDFNGDGFEDFIIGGPDINSYDAFGDYDEFSVGQSYLVFGTNQGLPASFSLDNLDGTNGLIFDGIDEDDFSGRSVSAAGDINGDGFDDLIIGAPGADPNGGASGEAYIIFGFGASATPTPGSDTLVGGSGNDTIDGLGGADLIQGLGGNDSLRGSAGKDTIEGGDGRDTILGGGGNDELDGGVGNDLLRGENGRDSLFGAAGSDTLEGRNGKDTLDGGAGSDNLFGGADEDTVSYARSASAVTVNLDTGTGSGGHAQGDSLNSVENLIGSNLSDNLTGDFGANRIEGGNGNDTIDGGDDPDRLFGDAGGDSIAGGLGNDTLIGGSGGDSMDGGNGNDSLSGGDDSDTLRGGGSQDSLSGGLGEDELFGDGGNDILRGNNNRDLLDGGGGSDTLIGGNGSDTLRGGTGNDSLNGSAGLDRYVFLNGDGNDTISFFQDGLDTLDVSQHTSVNNFSDITKTQLGSDLLVRFDGNDTVLIENFLDGNLTQSDFFF